MADVLLNGRKPLEWEIAAIEHGRQCERDRDAALLAGTLTEPLPRRHEGRPVADITVDFATRRRP